MAPAAQVIEANLDAVNAAIAAVNGHLATGMAWPDLERLLADERARGAPLARLIASLDLPASRATLLLDDWLALDDSDEDDDGGDRGSSSGEEGGGGHAPQAPRLRVGVDLTVNAYTNAKCATLPGPLLSP